jgi:hypothetical protein
MAKKKNLKKKGTPSEMWSRRQFNLGLVNTGIAATALGVSVCNTLKPAQTATIPIESGAYVANLAGIVTMTLSATGDLSVTPPDLV